MQQVPADQVSALLQTLQAAGLNPLLLDVREPWEVAQARLQLPTADTLCIPMQQVPQRLAEIDPTRPLLALCHHGMRSAQVLLFLAQHGYPYGYNIAGGIDAWSRVVDPTVPRY